MSASAPLEHERARDAEEASRLARRGPHRAVVHDEHVRSGRLAQLAARVREDRLGARRARGRSASARTFSAYEIVFSPAVAPRSLRGHGTIDDAPRSTATVRDGRRGDDHRRARRRRAREPSGDGPAGHGDAQPAVGDRVAPRAPRRRRRGGSSRSGTASPSPVGRAAQPLEVAAPRERYAAVDAQRLEHAVADEQAVVERRDPRAPSVGDERAVEPDEPCSPRRDARACTCDAGRVGGARAREQPGGLELGLVPLAAGSESATIPPPTPSVVRPSRDGERADRDREIARRGARCRSSRPRRSTRRGARARGPRSPGARVASGAPVTDAGGNVGAQQRAEPDVGSTAPAHRAHEVHEPGMVLDRAQLGDRIDPDGTRDRGRCGPGRRSSRSRRGPSRSRASAAAIGGVPLIGRVSTVVAVPRQESLGRRATRRRSGRRRRERQQHRVACAGVAAASAPNSATGSAAGPTPACG